MKKKMELCDYIFHGGEFVSPQKANISILNYGLNFGAAIFEAIRIYESQNGVNIVGLKNHLDRLKNSHRLVGLGNLNIQEIENSIYKFIDINNLKNAYVRIVVYPVKDCLSFDLTNTKSAYSIFGWHADKFSEGATIILECSKYHRPEPNMTLPLSKVCGLYVMDAVAHNECVKNGFDEALFLNADGTVCEAAGANIFYVKNNVLYTPDIINTIKGITREIVFDICKKIKIKCVEKRITLDDLITADEVFLTGTFHGLKRVSSISNIKLENSNGSHIYRDIFNEYQRIIENSKNNSLSRKWITSVPYKKNSNSKDCGNYKIRLATLSDREFIEFALKNMMSTIRKDGKEPDVSGWEDAFTHIINNPHEGIILIADNEEGYIGYISISFHTTLHTKGQLAVIEEIWVDPGKQSTGVGTSLLKEAEKYIQNEGINRIDLGSAKNEKLYKFYSDRGYQDIGLRFKKILS